MSRPFPDPPATLAGALERAAAAFPDRGIALFDGRGRSCERRTFPEVLATARRGAARWADVGVAPGDRVLVSLPTSWELLEAWLGAVARGALPVAVAPAAGFGAAEAQIRRIEDLVERLDARRAVVSAGFLRDAESAAAHRTVAAAVTPEQLAAATPADAAAPMSSVAPDEVAFLQLTSGSTGLPRAVMIPHRSAIHNALAIDEAIGAAGDGPVHGWADALVGWLPLHHDMGLVGYLLSSIVTGVDLYLLPPTTFLARPRRWLELLGEHGATVAHGPNFGYQLCLERLSGEERRGLDLSRWRAAQNGAEMIRPETIAAFNEAFGPHGFRPETFRPCFGLAEGSLAVTLDRRGRGVRFRPLPARAAEPGVDLSEVACLGEPVRDTEVRITDAAGRAVAAGEVGEVRVRGPGVFAGYYNDPEATAEALVDGWLRTGDLGFLAESELYLTGRSKDLLIVRGHNVMPHEIEWLAESVTGGGGALRSGAFSLSRGARGEEAVLVVEVNDRDPDWLATCEREIRLRVAHDLTLQLADVAFVRRGKIPKTTSGKVQRRELREMYVRGDVERL